MFYLFRIYVNCNLVTAMDTKWSVVRAHTPGHLKTTPLKHWDMCSEHPIIFL